MADENQASETNKDLEKYRIRYGLYKVLAGTAFVGLVSVLIPGAVDFFENQRKERETNLAHINQQQAYVKDFLKTALDQDIELRIRFADYFAHVAADPFKKDWRAFHGSLVKIIGENRNLIHAKELEIRQALAEENPSLNKQIEIAELERQLEWLYRELGYVEKDRSVVRSAGEKADQPVGEAYKIAPKYEKPIIYSQELVDRIIEQPGVPYPETSRLPEATNADIIGIVLHNAAAPDSSVRVLREGRPGLYGPMTNWVVLSDGTIEFIKTEGESINHVGRAGRGLENSNTISVFTTGMPAFEDRLQVDNLVRLVADIADRWSIPTEMIVSHAEVALPHGRKRDMGQQAPGIRQMVDAVRSARTAE